MVSPRKRKNSRSENRASQRYTPPSPEASNPSGGTIPRPPDSCNPWHFYWCDGHNDWHHHDEFVVTAIQRTMSQPSQGDAIGEAMDRVDRPQDTLDEQ